MAWAGTGVLLSMQGGILKCSALGDVIASGGGAPAGDFHFVQISDSHIGFSEPANTNVVATCGEAVKRIGAMSAAPSLKR